MSPTSSARRPLKSRDTRWANAFTAVLVRHKVPPNLISLSSVLIAVVGAVLLLLLPHVSAPITRAAFLVGAAVCVQLRLLCNLLDGMVAVEGGLGSRSGEVWNDVPDRIADPLFLVSAGYATGWQLGPELGWIAGSLAIFTAYVRLLGGASGLKQRFTGPMAKPHRMAALTASFLLAALMAPWGWDALAVGIGLVVVAFGTLVTVGRRTFDIVRELEAK